MATEGEAVRPSSLLASRLRDRILSGMFTAGDMLPSVRELSRRHGFAPKTVHKVLQRLADEGLIRAEPRRGYRVRARAHDPRRNCPIAFVLAFPPGKKPDSFHRFLATHIQEAAALHGWSVLVLNAAAASRTAIAEQLITSRVWGVLIDTLDLDLAAGLRDTGIPVVMVDAWSEEAPFDSVLQDNYQGGFLAASHLLKKGHRRIAWLGPLDSLHARERFGGACAALGAEGMDIFPPDLRHTVAGEDPAPAVAALLSSSPPPTAILALWRSLSLGTVTALKKAGRVPGRDVEVVGWCPLQFYDRYRSAGIGKGYVPPVITWDLAEMARIALVRLEERWHTHRIPPLRINIELDLKLEGK